MEVSTPRPSRFNALALLALIACLAGFTSVLIAQDAGSERLDHDMRRSSEFGRHAEAAAVLEDGAFQGVRRNEGRKPEFNRGRVIAARRAILAASRKGLSRDDAVQTSRALKLVGASIEALDGHVPAALEAYAAALEVDPDNAEAREAHDLMQARIDAVELRLKQASLLRDAEAKAGKQAR